MSSEPKSNLPDHDAIIDELTRDLSSQCIKDEVTTAVDGSAQCNGRIVDKNSLNRDDVSYTSHKHELPVGPTEGGDYDRIIEETSRSDQAEEHSRRDEANFIDEEMLKDLEVTLTDDQKEERKVAAIECKNRGNEMFKAGNYDECHKQYTEGLNLCPLRFPKERAFLYANRAACQAKLDNKELAIEDCSKAIELDNEYIRALLRRASLYEQTDKLDEAFQDYKTILALDPSVSTARQGVATLPARIEARNEQMKQEMLGKLKDFGNLLLKPFGLSTSSFQMTQDPNTGGYSVNFSQK